MDQSVVLIYRAECRYSAGTEGLCLRQPSEDETIGSEKHIEAVVSNHELLGVV